MKYLSKEPFTVATGWCFKNCDNRGDSCDDCFKYSKYEEKKKESKERDTSS